jgi:hypothetical protein
VYWRLLSSDPQITKNVVLSEKPSITTTIQTLPPALLDSLIAELSTLASVYHKPASTFLGKGKFGAEEMQKAAIEEQAQLAKENSTVAAIAAGGTTQKGAENLLDIDFDGAVPASGGAKTEGLAGTPQRVASPAAGQPTNAMEDLMGVFGGPPTAAPASTNGGGGGLEDLMGGFGDMSMNGSSSQQQPKKTTTTQTNDDILGLF